MTEYEPLHGPSRPGWTCVSCGDEWPCGSRKRQLRELFEGSRASLANYMSGYLKDAIVDLDGLAPEQVFNRMLGWCRRPSSDRRRTRPDLDPRTRMGPFFSRRI
nr:flavin reductase [Micromonospora sp. DSM 115978]